MTSQNRRLLKLNSLRLPHLQDYHARFGRRDPALLGKGHARDPQNPARRVDHDRDEVPFCPRNFPIDEHVLQLATSGAPSGRNRSPGRRSRTDKGGCDGARLEQRPPRRVRRLTRRGSPRLLIALPAISDAGLGQRPRSPADRSGGPASPASAHWSLRAPATAGRPARRPGRCPRRSATVREVRRARRLIGSASRRPASIWRADRRPAARRRTRRHE